MPYIGNKPYAMSGTKGLLDSNVIIDLSKGNLSTEDLVKDYDSLYTSIISYVETLGYSFTDEEERTVVLAVLNQVEIVDLNQTIADIAIEYRQRRKIKLPDALVLATAKHLDADLLTNDIHDFKNVDPSVQLIAPKKL
jgi:predicted nucleic acid-binding protein